MHYFQVLGEPVNVVFGPDISVNYARGSLGRLCYYALIPQNRLLQTLSIINWLEHVLVHLVDGIILKALLLVVVSAHLSVIGIVSVAVILHVVDHTAFGALSGLLLLVIHGLRLHQLFILPLYFQILANYLLLKCFLLFFVNGLLFLQFEVELLLLMLLSELEFGPNFLGYALFNLSCAVQRRDFWDASFPLMRWPVSQTLDELRLFHILNSRLPL